MVLELLSGDSFWCVIIIGFVFDNLLELSILHGCVTLFTRHSEEVSESDCYTTIFVSEILFYVGDVLFMLISGGVKSGVSVSCGSEGFTVVVCSSSRFLTISQGELSSVSVDLMLIIVERSLEYVRRFAEKNRVSFSFLDTSDLSLDISGLNDNTILSFMTLALLEHVSLSSS